MSTDQAAATATAPEPAGLIDLTGMPLADLWTFDGGTALDAALRKVAAAAEDRDQWAVSAFNSSI